VPVLLKPARSNVIPIASLNAKFTNSMNRDSGVVALAQQEVCTTLMRGLLQVHQDQASVLRPKYNHMNKLQKTWHSDCSTLSEPEARPRIGRGHRDG
jgi:hypothetical protein